MQFALHSYVNETDTQKRKLKLQIESIWSVCMHMIIAYYKPLLFIAFISWLASVYDGDCKVTSYLWAVTQWSCFLDCFINYSERMYWICIIYFLSLPVSVHFQIMYYKIIFSQLSHSNMHWCFFHFLVSGPLYLNANF
jgi:hypothetical protein